MNRLPHLAAACLLALALIHAAPLAGVVGAEALREGYGLGALDAPTTLLLRHRALLFGLLAAGLLWALWRPSLRTPILLGVALADLGFVVLAAGVAELPDPLRRIMLADLLALLLAATAALAMRAEKPPGDRQAQR